MNFSPNNYSLFECSVQNQIVEKTRPSQKFLRQITFEGEFSVSAGVELKKTHTFFAFFAELFGSFLSKSLGAAEISLSHEESVLPLVEFHLFILRSNKVTSEYQYLRIEARPLFTLIHAVTKLFVMVSYQH